jgi:hypothetical protein
MVPGMPNASATMGHRSKQLILRQWRLHRLIYGLTKLNPITVGLAVLERAPAGTTTAYEVRCLELPVYALPILIS